MDVCSEYGVAVVQCCVVQGTICVVAKLDWWLTAHPRHCLRNCLRNCAPLPAQLRATACATACAQLRAPAFYCALLRATAAGDVIMTGSLTAL
jgi:hypothetical protein